jgi:hypothetical protein
MSHKKRRGYSIEEVLKNNFWEFTRPDGREKSADKRNSLNPEQNRYIENQENFCNQKIS